MSEKNPQAFPAFIHPDSHDGHKCRGMSLRDWFAGQAPPAPDNFTIEMPECADWQDSQLSAQTWSDWHVRRAVAWSWAYADAMLAERERSQP